MATGPSPKEIEQRAAEWLARCDSGLSAEEQSALSAWLAADPRHLGAYARAQAVMAQLDRAGAGGADALRRAVRALPAPDRDALISRRRALWAASAAAGVAAAGAGLAWGPLLLGRERYSTGLGETREVVLPDGSLMTLNTASSVLVHYGRDERRIILKSGEALFDVARNKARPFIVEASDTLVRAVGTSFTVKLLPQEAIKVLVREGVVEVKRPETPEAEAVKLGANAVAVAPARAPTSTAQLTQVQVTRDLAWREGRIAFDNQTLADAAREFSRYSDIRILVAPGAENQTITGLYVANDPVGFAKAAALSLGLRAEIRNRDILLSRPGEGE
jgi:transmembrane sensor